jgi:two-component system chemotaxis sensor kinase CheA
VKVDLEEFRSAFVAEADEHLAAGQSLLLAMERALRNGEGVQRELRELLRLLHTVKGLAAMVGVEPIVSLAHEMESVLRAAERMGGVVDEPTIEALLEGTRAIQSRVRAVAENRAVPAPAADFLAALRGLEPATSIASAEVTILDEVAAKLGPSELQQLRSGARSGRRAVRIDFAPSASQAAAGISITSVREKIGELGEIVKVVPLSPGGGLVFAIVVLTTASNAQLTAATGLDAVTELLSAAPPSVASFEPEAEADDDATMEGARGVLRVEVGRVDAAIELLGTLVVTRSRMALAVERLEKAGADTRDLRAIMADHARQLRELRGAILRVRMVPMAAVVERLPLVVRSLARTNGKKVRVVLDVANTELDKTVAERLFPALVHLVRNAVDHGIESPSDRVKAGKSEEAILRLEGSTRDRLVELRIRDDGRGVDRAAVAARTGKPVPTTDAELLELLCRPGLTTRSEADTTSGRGLGMDIVRRIVHKLGGELTLETSAGQGSTFVVRVPLTVAIVDAFTVRTGGERFAVPVPIVEEIIELASERVTAPSGALGSSSQRLLARRGETVPLFDLAEALSLPRRESAPQALVIRGAGGDLVAYAVDRVLGQQEIVVRPLVDPLVMSGAISGATDLGDGRITVVLDLINLRAA